MKRDVNPKMWNEKRQRSTRRGRLSLDLNDYLDDTLAKILKIHQRFIDEKKLINPKTILDAYAGRIERPKMLREVFQQENDKYRQRLAIGDVVLNTVLRNERAECQHDVFRFGIFLYRFNQLLVKCKPLKHIDSSTATHHINSVSVQVIHYGYDREFVSLGL